jgi:hypothetical protein
MTAAAAATPAKHTHDVVFGRKVAGCPRCQQLASGAAPIVWGFKRRAEMEAEQIRAIRTHNCKAAGCGPVCTFGEW